MYPNCHQVGLFVTMMKRKKSTTYNKSRKRHPEGAGREPEESRKSNCCLNLHLDGPYVDEVGFFFFMMRNSLLIIIAQGLACIALAFLGCALRCHSR